MSQLNMTIPHQLSQEEALGRIKQLLGNLKEEQKSLISAAKEEWEGNTGHFMFTAKGFDLSGVIQVNPGSVDIDAKLPFALSFFKGAIEKVIEQKATALLAG